MSSPHRYTFIEREPISEPGGVNPAFWVTHSSYGKESVYSEDSPSPYLFPNEWIAACLGHFLRLPLPAFCVMRMGAKQPPMFTSLQFTPDRTPPPDANPAECWKRHPALCTGIVLFDILIGNEDRAQRHITVDDPDNPQELIPYDHDIAVAGAMYGDARKRFKNQIEEFLADYHCIVPLIDSDKHFLHWIGRIESIPEWFIESICDEAQTKGFRQPEANAAAKFLKWRSRHFTRLLQLHKGKFTGIKQWTTWLI